MTKADLLLLCAHWRLRSDRWRRRGNRPTRPLPDSAPAASDTQLALVVERPLFAQPLRLDAPETLQAADVWAHIGANLRPLVLRCGPLIAGPSAAALAARDTAASRLYRRELPVVRTIEAQWVGRQATLPGMQLSVHAAVQALPANAATVPANAFAMPPAVQAVPLLAQVAVSYYGQLQALGGARIAEPGNSAAELTWLHETQDMHVTATQLFTQIAALLAATAHATASTHVAVSSMLVDLIATHVGADLHAFTQRRRWLEELPENDDDDLVPYRLPLMAPLDMPCPHSLLMPSGCFGAIAV
jgi:hypothetical protein